jgi:hypothetical protein
VGVIKQLLGLLSAASKQRPLPEECDHESLTVVSEERRGDQVRSAELLCRKCGEVFPVSLDPAA